MINAPIFKGFLQAGPLPLEAAIDLVTKVLQYVKVHLSNAPTICLGEHYSFGPSSARGMVFLASLV
jgi:hypothetical protein